MNKDTLEFFKREACSKLDRLEWNLQLNEEYLHHKKKDVERVISNYRHYLHDVIELKKEIIEVKKSIKELDKIKSTVLFTRK